MSVDDDLVGTHAKSLVLSTHFTISCEELLSEIGPFNADA